MKVRQGFVSNSSSSSFIINGNDYTCVDIALHAIDVMESEDGFEYKDDDYYEKLRENLNNFENKNTAIKITMCDDLEICKSDGNIYVDASNHYDWDFPADVYGGEGEYYEKFEAQEKVLIPEHNVYGRMPDYDIYYHLYNRWVYRCENENCET